jgi:hypothetical protein
VAARLLGDGTLEVARREGRTRAAHEAEVAVAVRVPAPGPWQPARDRAFGTGRDRSPEDPTQLRHGRSRPGSPATGRRKARETRTPQPTISRPRWIGFPNTRTIPSRTAITVSSSTCGPRHRGACVPVRKNPRDLTSGGLGRASRPDRRSPRVAGRPIGPSSHPGADLAPRSGARNRRGGVILSERRAFSCRRGSLSSLTESSSALERDGRRHLQRAHRRARTGETIPASSFRPSIPAEFLDMVSLARLTPP